MGGIHYLYTKFDFTLFYFYYILYVPTEGEKSCASKHYRLLPTF
jgi:hypothetical protein